MIVLPVRKSWAQRHADWLVSWYREGFIAFCLGRDSWMERGSIIRSLVTLEFFDVFCSLVLIIWTASLIRGYGSRSWNVYCKSAQQNSGKLIVMLIKLRPNKTPHTIKPHCLKQRVPPHNVWLKSFWANINTVFDMKILAGKDCITFLLRKFVTLSYSNWKAM